MRSVASIVRSRLRLQGERIVASRYSRRLSRNPSAVFTQDYVSRFTELWEQLFAPFAGREGLRVLEIGTFEGRSLAWLLDHVATNPTSHVTVVDRFHSPLLQARFEHNLQVGGSADRVTTLSGNSSQILWGLPDASFDLVYVDGGHSAGQVLIDGVLGWRKLRSGGILLFDDYEWRQDLPIPDRPQAAIDAIVELIGLRGEVVHHDYQVAVRKLDSVETVRVLP